VRVNARDGSGRAGWGRALLAVACLSGASAGAAPQAIPSRAALCDAVDRGPRELAVHLQAEGDAARDALRALVRSRDRADVLCGLAGLAALRDDAAVPPLLAAMRDAAYVDDRYRLARWAAFIAGGPDPSAGQHLAPLLDLFEDTLVWRTSGDDAIRFLGELDDPRARDRLLAELARPGSEAGLDATIHALARQAEPRARGRVSALGGDVAATLGGNATYEQARRLGAAAFYLLVLGPDTEREGLGLLARLAPQDQADTAAWATATLCEQAVRRPETRAALAVRHRALTQALTAAGVRWNHLARGAFPCVPPD